MKHLPILLRLLFAVALVPIMAFVHSRWGEQHPDGGPGAFFIIIVFWFVGMVAAAAFYFLSTFGQSFFRTVNVRRSLLIDLIFFVVFAGALAYLGLTATYTQAEGSGTVQGANNVPQRTRSAPLT